MDNRCFVRIVRNLAATFCPDKLPSLIAFFFCPVALSVCQIRRTPIIVRLTRLHALQLSSDSWIKAIISFVQLPWKRWGRHLAVTAAVGRTGTHLRPPSACTTAPSPDPGVSGSRVKVQRRSATEPDSAVNLPHRSPQTHTLSPIPRGGGLAAPPPLANTDRWMDWISPISRHLLQISHHEGFATASASVKVTFSHSSAPPTLAPLFLEERGRLSSRPLCRASEQTRYIWRWPSAEIFYLFKHQLGRNAHERKDPNTNE